MTQRPPVADWATDAAHVADALGAERLAVVGLSGGGPYALACGAAAPLAGRVAAVGVLGGVVPSVGPDAAATGAIDLARQFAPLSALRRPLPVGVTGLLLPVVPFCHFACRAYASITPEGDQRVLHDPEMEGMFVDDPILSMRGGLQANRRRRPTVRTRVGFPAIRRRRASAVVARRRRSDCAPRGGERDDRASAQRRAHLAT